MQSAKLEELAQWSVGLEISGTAVKTAAEARDIHINDSLAGLDLDVVREAGSIIDIGSGAGFPGLVLAAELPEARVVLVDSVRKKMEVAGRFAREHGLENVECIWGRAEEIAEQGSPHREAYDVVTARALAPLAVLLEYAAPLLKLKGSLVAWKGSPSEEELSSATGAAEQLGFGETRMIETKPFAASRSRHFYVATRNSPVPDRFPRRPGVALKRPLA